MGGRHYRVVLVIQHEYMRTGIRTGKYNIIWDDMRNTQRMLIHGMYNVRGIRM